MATECSDSKLVFKSLSGRRVEADFSGGQITSDAGALLLRQADHAMGLSRRFAACFTDHRKPGRIEHPLARLVAQRVYGLALGYEDLNDHDILGRDPMLALAVDQPDLLGQQRLRTRDAGRALAGKSTLNRLELTPGDATPQSRYAKIVYDSARIEELLVDLFWEAHVAPPQQLILDFDVTDDPLHGGQEGRFFHGYYKEYCYLPLYVFCGDHLLLARLQQANGDAAAGTIPALEFLVERLRARWPGVPILLRGDSGFTREETLVWCEQHQVDYLLGLAKNERLTAILAAELKAAEEGYRQTGAAYRVFKEFTYQTRTSWSRERRVVGKAEHLAKGANPRFVVTSLSVEQADARRLYEDIYCARGEMENRIKEQQLCLFADRTSTATMRANQLRLFFSSLAYVLVAAVRRLGLAQTAEPTLRCDTIRLKLFKIGAAVKVTARRIWITLSGGCPSRQLFSTVAQKLIALPLRL